MTKNLKIILSVGAGALLVLGVLALLPLQPVPKLSIDTQQPSSQVSSPSEQNAVKALKAVQLAPTTEQTVGACRPTGCSKQVCSDTDIITTCEYRSEYACYKTASCARQSDGKCGWTQTPELKKCIDAAPKGTSGPQ